MGVERAGVIARESLDGETKDDRVEKSGFLLPLVLMILSTRNFSNQWLKRLRQKGNFE